MSWSVSGRELVLWRVPLGADWSYDACSVLLNAAELWRAQRLRVPAKQRSFVVGRAALKMILSLYLNCSPTQLEFAYNTYGKPYIAGVPWTFNLAHSAHTMLVVVGQDASIGVDLEWCDNAISLAVAKKFCHPVEYALLNTMAGLSQVKILYDLWSLKEAVIKAHGIAGTITTFKSLCLLPNLLDYHNSHDANVLVLDNGAVWYFDLLTQFPEFAAAIVSCEQFIYDTVWELTPDGAKLMLDN